MWRKILYTVLLCLGLVACQTRESGIEPIQTATLTPSSGPTITATLTVIPPPTVGTTMTPALSPTPSMVVEITPILSESPRQFQVVVNSSFDANTAGWERPNGRLSHTTSEFHTAPGAARLETTELIGGLDYSASTGQCIDLSSQLEKWPVEDGRQILVLEAYLQTNASIGRVTLNGIFSDDPGCGPGHVGYFAPVTVAGNQAWTRAATEGEIPAGAQSLHIFFWASGVDNTGVVVIDDVLAYAPVSD